MAYTSVVSSGISVANEKITKGAQSVYSGGTTSKITITNSGIQNLYGSAINTYIKSGGSQNILFGGKTASTVISSGGYQYVGYGASAANTIVKSGGSLCISGNGIISGLLISSGGVFSAHTSDTIIAGINKNRLDGASNFIISNGTASNLYLNGSFTVFEGHRTYNTMIVSGGSQYIFSTGRAIGTTINSGGWQYVDGGSAVNTTIIRGARNKLPAAAARLVRPCIKVGNSILTQMLWQVLRSSVRVAANLS